MTEAGPVKLSLGDRWRGLSQDGKIVAIIGLLVLVVVVYKVALLLFVAKPPTSALSDELVSWQKYVQKNPTDPAGLVGLGSTYQMLGDLNDAKGNFDQALKMDPKNLAAKYAIAKWYEAKNDTPNAIKYLLMVGSASPQSQKYVAYFDLGQLYQTQHQYQKAITYYRDSLDSNETMADVHLALGQCYEQTHQLQQALTEYEYAYQFNNPDPPLQQKIKKLQQEVSAGR